MQINLAFPSKRLLLSLFFCASSVILLQNYNISRQTSFLLNLISLACGIVVCFIIFIPSIILKKKYNTDLTSNLRFAMPHIHYAVFALYIAYFVYTIEFFLLRYTDMFHQKYFSDAPVDLVALAMVAVCVYGAYRGTNIITRFGILLFVFALVCYLTIFGGSVSSLDFFHYGFDLSGGIFDAIDNSVFLATSSFVAVIFLCTSSYTENFKLRQSVIMLVFLALEVALVLFFDYFALGDYSERQSFQTYLLSKVSRVSGVSGIESLFFALATLCVFITISLCLCSINKGLNENKSLLNVTSFGVIVFVLHICAGRINAIKELLINPFVFLSLTVFFAVAIPVLYMILFRRKLND